MGFVMNNTQIDRLILHLHDIDAVDPRSLAEHLGAELGRSAPGASRSLDVLPPLRLHVGAAASVDSLSRQIASEILRAVANRA
jgi:hypothetical protein